MREADKFSVPKTFLLGCGFMGVSVIWSMYNAYVPVFLEKSFHLDTVAIGVVMTIDNIFAIVLLPFLGALSDRTRSPLGRRRPYILVGSILAAVFFVMIPSASAAQKLGLMMLFIVAMNLSMALFRTPVITLMPDITPSRYRSQANGIINLMGGLGSLLVFFGGKPLYDRSPSLVFLVGGLAMLGLNLIVVFLIREPVLDPVTADKKAAAMGDAFRELLANMKDVVKGEKSLLAILLAIFCWFVGYNAIETFFTLYAENYLKIGASTGTLILGAFSVTFMLTAVVAGLVASRFGRRRTIRVGLGVVLVVMLSSLFLKSFWPLVAVFLIGGFGWALVNVNSLPMVVDMTTPEKLGGYTGLYYFFSQAANIVSPPVAGALIDAFGYQSLMIYAAVLFLASILIVSLVRRGEAAPAS